MINLPNVGIRLAGPICWFVCVLATSSILAHPFHTSVAELDWNASTGRWEVSVRIHASDLELALARQSGNKLDVEGQQASQYIQQYVESRFQLVPQAEIERLEFAANSRPIPANEKSNTCRIDWVGQEVEGSWMWLYFELTPPESKQPLALVSQLLTDVNEDQINIVSIRQPGKKRTTQQTSRKQMWIGVG